MAFSEMAACAYAPPARISAATQIASISSWRVAPWRSAAFVCPQPNVNEQLSKRVKEAAAKLGYHRNSNAASLRSNQTDMIRCTWLRNPGG